VDKKKIAYLISHPIQYHSPLFAEWAKNAELDLTVIYCSKYGLQEGEKINPLVGKTKKWDIPLLEGYHHVFLRNYSPKPSHFAGFIGLINLGLLPFLIKQRCDVIIINGWRYFTYIYAILLGVILGIKVYIRGDNTIIDEEQLTPGKKYLKKILLGRVLFPMVSRFLYVGEANKDFFRYYGVPHEKLIFTPHAVDNRRFTGEYNELVGSRDTIKKELGLDTNSFTILFLGKLISKKQPLDLLKAFERLELINKRLIFIGYGPLQEEMETYINEKGLQGVQITGFKNQSELGKYLISGDVFVLPSSFGETWGLVVNEAMNFHLPVITSNRVGCSLDLVMEGENGFVFESGNIEELTTRLEQVFESSVDGNTMGKSSARIVKDYSYETITRSILNSLNE